MIYFYVFIKFLETYIIFNIKKIKPYQTVIVIIGFALHFPSINFEFSFEYVSSSIIYLIYLVYLVHLVVTIYKKDTFSTKFIILVIVVLIIFNLIYEYWIT